MNLKLEPPTCDDRLIRELWLSAYLRPTVTVADELGVFPLLEQAPATVAELGARLSLPPRAAEAMMATLAAAGLLVSVQGRFHLTEVSRNFLLPAKPFYWGHMLRLFRDIPLSHERLLEALRKDEPSVLNDGNVVTDTWEAAELPPEQAVAITRAMHSHSMAIAVGLARQIDLSGTRRLLDVAGGSGCFCIALAQHHPEIRFTVADLPAVCRVTEQYVAEHDLRDRIDVMALDMFRGEWPSSHDAIFFANILHDWDRARRSQLLRRSFEALPPGGRILLCEMLLSDGQDGPLTAALFSVNMVYLTLGKQFTAGELDALLRECGFVDVSVTPVVAGYSLISASKPPLPKVGAGA